MDYKKYVGQYVKRFYTKFDYESMYRIGDYREKEAYTLQNELMLIPEFFYKDGKYDSFWTDVEDSVIITNELPIVQDERVANVNDPEYKGYNPFTKTNKATLL
jgi:hypothetical protein